LAFYLAPKPVCTVIKVDSGCWQSYEIKLPPEVIWEFKILELFSVEKLSHVGCYDVAKFRFVNSDQL
jgi:hypothetical protein